MDRANRLIHEPSPYLRQHAHNPVDWYPWGPEALDRARREERPIFLSVGYSTCHWCHVMERESFEDPGLAELINAHFVPVKVDREERPDLDHLYMTAVQAVTGRGGWPMTVVLTPALKPFFAGTYFPPEDRGGLPGLRRVLTAVLEAWRERRAEVEDSAESVARFLAEVARPPAAGPAPGAETLQAAFEQLAARFDPAHGGFGGAPKFPTPHQLTFLLHHHARTGDPRPLQMAVATLDAMNRGGIHDHLGGGFHRYSTDTEWLAPHFEKMLYDQALLLEAYVAAWQATGGPDFAAAARDICEYLLRDLRHPEGGFYSAEDADSEGEEGRFYVWSLDQVRAALGAAADTFARVYDVSAAGNWEGRTILRRRRPLAEAAAELGTPPAELEAELARGRAALLAARA
ncbi:MAG TPA: thioredoxin domain-containing protein, partial [Candidatus Saccharimonadales bacterium]|nr:thioredoxin domain-containing protein [Candidatus Saccharimonadales bacterium]